MPPGFLLSALAGLVGALVVSLASPRRRGNLGWAMLAGLVGGAASGLALFELGIGTLGGAQSIFEAPDQAAAQGYAMGGAIGGAALCLIHQTLRSAMYRPRPSAKMRRAMADGARPAAGENAAGGDVASGDAKPAASTIGRLLRRRGGGGDAPKGAPPYLRPSASSRLRDDEGGA